jgi:hypothetical protein
MTAKKEATVGSPSKKMMTVQEIMSTANGPPLDYSFLGLSSVSGMNPGHEYVCSASSHVCLQNWRNM